MKKLYRIFRICSPFVLVVILVLCICRISCISVPSTIYRADYPDDSNPFLDDYTDILHESVHSKENGYGTKENFSKVMKDREEERVRSFVSEHEIPKEIPTKLKILGDLATPPPDSNIKLDFVPRQMYVQVRRYDTEIHLPRSAALAEVETVEDALNAPRLREVVSQKKTQEVYEEQGYEDAAYDHGGYKKAGQHHESKYVPREHKTDITDQSTEQAEIVNVGRYNITDSSHSHRQITTTEKSQINKNRRSKRPKGGRNSWSRHKQNNKMKNSKLNGTGESMDKTTYKRLPSSLRRPKVKNNKNNTNDESKSMEESKFHVTRKLITELEIQPTTYHPTIPSKILNVTKTTNRFVHQLFLPPRIGNDGYKFENPFENFKDFNDVRLKDDSSSSKAVNIENVRNKPIMRYLYSPHVSKELIKYGESRDVNNVFPSGLLVKSKLNSKFRSKSKPFPYELIENKKTRVEKKSNRGKPTNFNFPYKIVENDIGLTKSATTESSAAFTFDLNGQKRKKLRKQQEPIFGPPDSSPWIPITPKDVYDIHGYERKPFPSTEVKTNEDSVKEKIGKKQRLSPVRMYDPLKTVSTSYSIQHVYPANERYSSKQISSSPFRTKQNQYNWPDLVKSTSKFNISSVVESPPAVHLDTVVQPTILRPAIELKSNRKSISPAYDIITAHSSDIRGAFAAGRLVLSSQKGNGSMSQLQQHLHRSNNSIALSSGNDLQRHIANRNTTDVIVDISPGVSGEIESGIEPIKEIETPSTNRYSIFKRVNYTLPINSTTAGMSQGNNEFSTLFSNDGDSFLFRHPHLPRETPIFRKTYIEDDVVSNGEKNGTTSKRDIILSSVKKNGSVTHLTKVSKRNDIYQEPILVYPQDYDSSAKYVEKLTLAHFSVPDNVAYNPVPLNYNHRLATLTSHLQKSETRRFKRSMDDNDENEDNGERNRDEDYASDVENEEFVNVFLAGTTTEISVNVKKYPFYKTIPPDGISKYSVLRYASNPVEIPKKDGQMTFYASKNKIECEEPTPPQNIVPQRENGEWAFDRKPKLPRITLGDKITCLKMKFFGSDPLDNPFFKEDSVGFPVVLADEIAGDPEHTKHVEPIGDFEEVESAGEHEILPKSFYNSLEQKNGKRVKKKSSLADGTQLERTVIKSSEPNAKSSTRKWIESLTEPRYTSGLMHDYTNLDRRPPNRPSEKLNDTKRVQKILFVGGFINRENNTNTGGKGKEEKLRTTTSWSSSEDVFEKASTTPKSDITVKSTISYRPPATYIYSTPLNGIKNKSEKLPKDSRKKPIRNKTEFTNDGTVLNELPHASQTTISINAEKIKQFNDDLTQFSNKPRTAIRLPNTESEEESAELDVPYTEQVFPDISDISKMKNEEANEKQNELGYNKKKTDSQMTHSSSASETVPKLSKTKKKTYVDISSSLRNQQNLSKIKSNDNFEDTTYKHQYKEPTWRRLKTESTTPVSVINAISEIDSLLYVIHPKTGEGKWMKLLKIEEMDDDGTDKIKIDSLSSSNDRRINTITAPPNFLNIPISNEDYVTKLPPPCHEAQVETKKSTDSNENLYHINGLLKQVAPRKANEVEINNLQTTEEEVHDEEDELNSHSDLDDDLNTSKEYPEPHERLYYYVVDDENKE